MGGNSNVKLIDDNGIRIDGRKVDELRPIKIEAGVLKSADGSAYVEIGKNKVLAAVYGPRECHPRHMQNPAKAIVQCKYNMIAFSVNDRKRPGPGPPVGGDIQDHLRGAGVRGVHRELPPDVDRCLHRGAAGQRRNADAPG